MYNQTLHASAERIHYQKWAGPVNATDQFQTNLLSENRCIVGLPTELVYS